MFKYQEQQWVIIESPNMRPIQAQITERVRASGSYWYKLVEKDTGNKVVWLEQDELTGETQQRAWHPEKELTPITHSPAEDNPNQTFKKKGFFPSKSMTLVQGAIIKQLLHETGGCVAEGAVDNLTFEDAADIIRKLRNAYEQQLNG